MSEALTPVVFDYKGSITVSYSETEDGRILVVHPSREGLPSPDIPFSAPEIQPLQIITRLIRADLRLT